MEGPLTIFDRFDNGKKWGPETQSFVVPTILHRSICTLQVIRYVEGGHYAQHSVPWTDIGAIERERAPMSISEPFIYSFISISTHLHICIRTHLKPKPVCVGKTVPENSNIFQ